MATTLVGGANVVSPENVPADLSAPTGPLLGAWTYAEFFSLAVAFLPPMALSSALHRGDPTQRAPGRWMRRFGRATVASSPVWDFSVEGTPPADILQRGYVVVCNHESTADPFLLSHLPFDMRWVAKEEIFKMPLLGLLMRAGGDIPIRRGDRGSVRDMMAECQRALAAGIPIMMFPEGTRSRTGELLPFKDGAFELALAAGVPILPLALAGTKDCRRKNSLWFGRARAKVRILPAIETAGMGPDDVATLRERARDLISAEVTSLRADLAAR
jgi:1-acyl-sn-glycerol-3-phosphate acyltransferase